MLLKSGDTLDHYRIEEHVAHTPTATIYKGRDLQTGCVVALKVPQSEAEADIVFYDRFQREAAIGRQLNHPNIPRVVTEAALRAYILPWNGSMERLCATF